MESQLNYWGPWKALWGGGTGLKLIPVVVRHPLGHLGMCWPVADASCPLRLSTITSPLSTYPPLICATCDITVTVKYVAQYPAVLAS